MNTRLCVALVVKNLQGKILIVKDEDEQWSLPSQSQLGQSNILEEELALRAAYNAVGIVMDAFCHSGDFLHDGVNIYKVYAATTDHTITKRVEYMWVDEDNIPDNLGVLTKAQLRKEFNPTLLTLYGTREKLS